VVSLDALDVGDNWQESSAMRGTGSHRVATPAGGVLVPSGRSLPLALVTRLDRPLYRLPLILVFVGSIQPMCLGALRRATAATIELASEKVSRLDGHSHGEEVRVQQAIADATAEHWCLTAGYRAILEEVWAAAEAGEPLPQELRARVWATLFLTVDRCRELVSRLFAAATSAAYATRNPVERALRDIHAVSATTESFQGLHWAAARVMLGHEPGHPAF
jgi:alkylation response protein AidB-like acyl-CoA dehydrogenase